MFGKAKSLIAVLCFSTCTIISIEFSTSYALRHKTTEVPGLYDGFRKVKILNTSNLERVIFEEQKQKLWLVEFYKHWCGDCMRFVPVLKALAIDIYGWRESVGIGVVDCANPINIEVCRNMHVGKVPTLRIFHPNSDKSFLGLNFGEEGNTTFTAMREKLAQTLKAYQNSQGTINGSVNLKLLTDSNLEQLWKKFPQNVMYLLLLFEEKDSLVGSQVALDISNTPEVRVRLVDLHNKNLSQLVGTHKGKTGVVFVERNYDPSVSPQFMSTAQLIPNKTLFAAPPYVHLINITNYTREGVNVAVRKYLISRGVNIAPDLPKIPILYTNITKEEMKEAARREKALEMALNVSDLNTVVFQMDLEKAINYVFTQEVSLTFEIIGEPLKALKKFVGVILKYFPTGVRGKILFEELKEKVLNNKYMIQGEYLQKKFKELENKYNPFMPSPEWVGCDGTIPKYRGYPCALWTMFHTLVALEELHDRNIPDEKPEALNAMVGYIKYFFSCSKCAEHFHQMAKTIAGNVTSNRDAVMWLWRAHNHINQRLAGDLTEDPRHHKVQFPTKVECPSCYSSDGVWDETRVFNFLSNMFTNIVHLDPHDLPDYPQ